MPDPFPHSIVALTIRVDIITTHPSREGNEKLPRHRHEKPRISKSIAAAVAAVAAVAAEAASVAATHNPGLNWAKLPNPI